MLERRIASYDRQNFRKRLNEFREATDDFMQDDLNEHNIYQVLYKTELFRNSIYKCIKLKMPMLPDYPLPGTEDGISEYEDECSYTFTEVMVEGTSVEYVMANTRR